MISGVRASSIRMEFDLVDDGEEVAPLHHLRGRIFHVVAQIVEAELVVGAVGHVRRVCLAPLRVGQVMQDAADLESQKLVDGAHPGGVALGQIVVDGDDMHALAGERVEIDGERGDQRLAFAGLHFGDAAVIQHHAADELHVEMALTDGALGGFAHGGEGLGDQIVERGAGADPGAEVLGARAQRLVGEGCDLGLERVDLLDDGPVFLELAVVGRTEDFAGESAKGKHGCVSLLSAKRFPGRDPHESPRKASKKCRGANARET